MNSLDQRQLQLHAPVLGWLLIVGHAIFLVIGMLVFLLTMGIGASTGDRETMTILSISGAALGLMFVVIGIPGLVAGAGLLARKSWARILAICRNFLFLHEGREGARRISTGCSFVSFVDNLKQR